MAVPELEVRHPHGMVVPVILSVIMADSGVFPELVGTIYDCVLLPERWPAVLDTIQREVGALSSYLIIHQTDPRAPAMSVLVEHNVDARMQRQYQQHYVRRNPLLPHLASTRDGNIYTCRHLVTQPEYLRGEFYQEWAAPQGWFDYAGVTMIRQDQASAAIGFTRGGPGNIFDDASLDLLQRLAPHLTRAAKILQMIEREGQSRMDLARLIGATRYGVLIVDSESRVQEANGVAEGLLARREGLSCKGRVIQAGEATSAVQAAVRAACRPNGNAPAGATVRVHRGPSRRPLVLQIMPLSAPGSVAASLALLPSRAAIFVVDPENVAHGSIEILADTYQLTMAERQVLERLAAGDSPAGISRALDIGMPTVRTHLHRIFDKTGTRRQSELLMLLVGFTPPIQVR